METVTLKRQLITDATGKPVGVILPLEEYDMVKFLLERNFVEQPTEESLSKEQAALSSIREAAFFGMWADRPELEGRSSRNWLEELRREQWTRS